MPAETVQPQAKPPVDTSMMDEDALVDQCYGKVMKAIANGDLKETLRKLIVRVRTDALHHGDHGGGDAR